MLIFPYKADVDLGRLPILTLMVCAVCVWVFARQAISASAYETALEDFCTHRVTRDELLALRYLDGPPDQHYCQVLLRIRDAEDPKAQIRQLSAAARSLPYYKERVDTESYIERVLTESWRRFERAVPRNLTDDLHYDPSTLNFGRMVTAAFSHGDVLHLVSNLIFFFAFAASVEVITGYFYFLGFVVLTAIGTHLAYAYSVIDLEGAPPTVGLSGVVMATMTFVAVVAPTLGIRVFFWFVVFVRRFRVPALGLAALYILQNIFDYANREPGDNINYIAHLSGAALGALSGMVYRYRHSEFIRDLLPRT